MPNKKLTDSEIVKALECCIESDSRDDCMKCPLGKLFYQECSRDLMKQTLDLINRQKEQYKKLCIDRTKHGEKTTKTILNLQEIIAEKEAEIERYKETVGELVVEDDGIVELLKGKETKYIKEETAKTAIKTAIHAAKAEAYKEFAERLKGCAYTESDICGYQSTVIDIESINNLLKEMVGAEE